MKKSCFLWISLLAWLWSCSENDRLVWDTGDGVYFSEYTAEADSLMYSFRITGLDKDTVRFEVKLQGAVLKAPARFCILADESSTAVPGLHYEALPESYSFLEGEAVMQVPVVILKKGTELDDKIVTLKLRLKATEELDIALPGRDEVRLLLTNQLVKPYYWNMPLSLYFGAYSAAKHLKCIEIMEHDFPLKDSGLFDYGGLSGYTYWMRAGRMVCNYYANHTEYDENGNLITTWEPL